MIQKRSLAVAAVLLFLLAGCGSSSKKSSSTTSKTASGKESTSAPTAAKSSGGDTIDIKGFAFSPKALKVSAGTKVTWTNGDSADHTSTADKGAPSSWDSGHLGKGKTFSYTFAKKGTYSYHCDIHTYMTGTVDVS